VRGTEAPFAALPADVSQLALFPIALLDMLLFIALMFAERCAAIVFPGTQLEVVEAPLALVFPRLVSGAALDPALP
jgi:hypothetical protein